MTNINRKIYYAFAALLFASLACNFGRQSAEPTPTAPPVPVTTQAVEELKENLSSAAEEAQSSGEVAITVTEAQLTSLVAAELQEQQDPVLQNPQVLLRDGQVQLLGDVNQGNISAPLQLVMTVTADENGRPAYEIVSGKIGPLPLPQALLDQLTAQLDSAFANQLGPAADEVFIEDITIADGLMTIQGHTR